MMIIDKERCINCGECIRECYGHYPFWRDGVVMAPEEPCLDCGHCLAVCPMEAVSLTGYDLSEVKPFDKMTMIPHSDHLLAALQYKRSIRRYKKKVVEQNILKQVLEAARYSPTAGNFQTMRFVILCEEKMALVKQAAEILYTAKQNNRPETALFRLELLETIYQASLKNDDKLFHGAPAVIVVIDKETTAANCANAYIAAARMELMAQSLGLGSCYVGLFLRAGHLAPSLYAPFALADDERVCLALAVGYPASFYRRTVPRKPLTVTWR